MPGTSSRADYLRLHANVSRRVRNLETGVHPTSTEDGLDDIIPFTDVILEVPFRHFGSGETTVHYLRWQRRGGVVTLTGGIEPNGNWTIVSDPALVGTLPAEARPIVEMLLNGAVSGAPWIFQYRVQPDGQIWLHKPPGIVGAGAPGCRFEGANWTVT